MERGSSQQALRRRQQEVRDRRSEVGRQTTEDRRQKTEVRDRGSESASRFQLLCFSSLARSDLVVGIWDMRCEFFKESVLA